MATNYTEQQREWAQEWRKVFAEKNPGYAIVEGPLPFGLWRMMQDGRFDEQMVLMVSLTRPHLSGDKRMVISSVDVPDTVLDAPEDLYALAEKAKMQLDEWLSGNEK